MKICDRLIAVGSVICYNESATRFSTFRTGGKIDTLVYPTSGDGVAAALDIIGDEPYTVLGNGSNTLISDDGVEEMVISLSKLSDHTIEKDGIYAMAGVGNTALSHIARDNCFKGIEFLAGIPGSFGGSLFMNAGAFGGEIGDYVEYIDVARRGHIERIPREDVGFHYRGVDLDGVIVGAKLRLEKGNPIIISNTIKKNQFTRRRSQPTLPSLGSVFRRVNDTSAGYYIERAGLSGYSIGGAEISTMHANFIVNTGNATSTDFMELVALTEDMVYKKFGIRLQREVRYIGRGQEKY